MEYPIKKYDELNRVIYIDWNGIERVIFIYWENTTKVKIKYRLFYQDQEVVAYDKNGQIIIEKSYSGLKLNLPRLVIHNGKTEYLVSKEMLLVWKQKLFKEKL